MKSDVSLLRRLGAITYDIFLVFSLVFFMIGLILLLFFDTKAQNHPILFYIVTVPTTYLYFVLSWIKGKQTLGMKAWKFQITQANHQHINHKQALIRVLSAALSFALLGFGFFYQLINKNNLSLHDIYSKTYLLRVSSD